jgi:hypothetical protein
MAIRGAIKCAVTVIALVALNGCGGTGGGSSSLSPQSNQATLQQGQWEFSFPSIDGKAPSYMEVNLQVTGTNYYAPTNALAGYAPYFNASVQPPPCLSTFGGCYAFPSGYVVCQSTGGDTFSGSTASQFTGSVVSSSGVDYGDLTATLNGTVLTNLSGQWSYTGTTSDYAPWLCEDGTTNNFIATAITPLNGNFAGTLQTSTSSTDQIAITISQNAYTVSASGTATGASFSISQADVIGALIYGSGTSTNVNGTNSFHFGGHIHADGRSVDVLIDDASGTAEWGTLIHQ